MAKEDLMEHATSTVDFYDLLGVNFETSESDIRRAYRKTALKYHPDKLGKDFDPEKFHLLQIAHDVLSDASAKAAYDKARSARLHKQKQHELFEGKRRQMKEDLESRERGAPATSGGIKRPREEDEMEREIRRLAEEGKRRRQEMEEKMKAYDTSPSVTAEATATKPSPPPVEKQQTAEEEAEEEDEVARLERRIQEAQEAKARRKAEKKARKSGAFIPADTPTSTEKRRTPPDSGITRDASTPLKRPGLDGIKADHKAAASPKFSFSPKTSTPNKDPFAATMDRLKERQRLEDEIRRQEAEAS